MIPIITLLVVLALALLMAMVATRALVHTGLSLETARFQAWSALSGVGFTTREAESVVNHPVRRRLVMILMLVGNVGIVTVVSSFILAFIQDGDTAVDTLRKVGVLFLGVIGMFLFAKSRWIDRRMKGLIDRALEQYTAYGNRDFESLIELTSDYRVAELYIQPGSWLAGQTLRTSGLRKEGLQVLGIRREDATWVGETTPDTPMFAGDNLIVYGRLPELEAIDHRRQGSEGDVEHELAMDQRSRRLEHDAPAQTP